MDRAQTRAGPIAEIILGNQKLQVTIHQVQGCAHFMGEGHGELARDGQAFLLSQLFTQQGDAFEEILQFFILALEFGQGLVNPFLKASVQATDLLDHRLSLRGCLLQLSGHEVEAIRDLAEFVLAFDACPGS